MDWCGIDDESLEATRSGIRAANDDDAEAEFDRGIESAGGGDEVIDMMVRLRAVPGTAGAEIEGTGGATVVPPLAFMG